MWKSRVIIMRLRFVLFAVVMASELSAAFNGFGWKKDQLTAKTCATHNNKLLSVLNILCNSTQTTSIQTRDACYGCFFRAGGISGSSAQLQALGQCANLYLMNTDYASCINELQSTVTSVTTAGCNSGYCNFVRCVRRINANNLIDDCFTENNVNRDLTTMANRVGLYTNVTSCILARARCSQYNPITGELQNQVSSTIVQQQYGRNLGTFVTKTSLINQGALYNSLQISTTGDIRIISFPATISTGDVFCGRTNGLEQAGYGTSTC